MLVNIAISFLLLGLTTAGKPGPRPPKGKSFDKYIFIVLENQDITNILKDPDFAAIAKVGLRQNNYHGVAHPSQPNCK